MKSFLVALLVSGLVVYSSQPSKASALPVAPVAETTSVGAGVYVAGGIIGVAAVLCVYDLYLKINGLKNWDGTPKKGVTPKFP